MSKPTVTVQDKTYAVDRISVVLQMNAGPLIYLGLYEKLHGTESKRSNEDIIKQEFLAHIYQEDEGSFQWGGTTLKFILVGCDRIKTTFTLIGLVIQKDTIDWLNKNNFADKQQDYLVYQKGDSDNSWPFFNNVIGNKCAQPNQDFVDRVELLFPENGCIWREKTASNFHFLNQSMAFASRYLPELRGWCAFDAKKPIRLILFEEQKQDSSVPKLDKTWLPSHLFLPNRYSSTPRPESACVLSREIDVNTGQEMALIKQLFSEGSNGEDEQKGKNFQGQNPARLLFSPGTVRIGQRNAFCHTVRYEFKLPAFGEPDSPSAIATVELDYPSHSMSSNKAKSLRLFGQFKAWKDEIDEETTVKIAPLYPNKWAIVDEKTQSLKSGSEAVLHAQILSRTHSDHSHSGIYIKHKKGDEVIVDIYAGGVPLAIGSVQKYRPELEKVNIALCGKKLALSVSPHSKRLSAAEAIMLNNAEIKLNHTKNISGQTQQTVDFLSKKIEISSLQTAINSGTTSIKSTVNISLPNPKTPVPAQTASVANVSSLNSQAPQQADKARSAEEVADQVAIAKDWTAGEGGGGRKEGLKDILINRYSESAEAEGLSKLEQADNFDDTEEAKGIEGATGLLDITEKGLGLVGAYQDFKGKDKDKVSGGLKAAKGASGIVSSGIKSAQTLLEENAEADASAAGFGVVTELSDAMLQARQSLSGFKKKEKSGYYKRKNALLNSGGRALKRTVNIANSFSKTAKAGAEIGSAIAGSTSEAAGAASVIGSKVIPGFATAAGAAEMAHGVQKVHLAKSRKNALAALASDALGAGQEDALEHLKEIQRKRVKNGTYDIATGSLSTTSGIVGLATPGPGTIAAAAIGGVVAMAKVGRVGMRKGKQRLRDKGYQYFNQNKTSDKKEQRYDTTANALLSSDNSVAMASIGLNPEKRDILAKIEADKSWNDLSKKQKHKITVAALKKR